MPITSYINSISPINNYLMKKKKELEKDGIKVSQKRVARRMKILGIKSVIIKKKDLTILFSAKFHKKLGMNLYL